MKKLFDHFWRKRPEVSTPPESQSASLAAPSSATPTKLVRPIATISVAPRTVRPAWQASTGPTPGKRLALQAERSEPAETLTLTLGDFWDRLPTDLLAADAPDRSTPLPFDLASLSERIGRGDPSIPVTEIARRIPHLFRANAVIAPDRVVMFPWKKIHTLIFETRDGASSLGLTPSGVEALSLKVRARKLHRPAKAAPTTPRSAAPSGSGSPQPETPAAPKSDPAIPEKLTLCAPTLLPAPETAAALENNVTTPAPASVSFQDLESDRQLTAMRTERDQAVAEQVRLHAELVALQTQTADDQEARSTFSKKLAGLETQLAAAVSHAEALQAERDAALARAAAVSQTGHANTDLTATNVRTAELIAERDAARAQAAQAIADGEAALALAAEQTAERDATLLRLKKLSAEHDAALARAADLGSERERENSHAAQLGGEMAAAVSHAAEATGERDAAVARATELAKERDAALARIAELEARPPQAQPTATADASACAGAQTPPEIESCRNTIQVLYAERDALRQEQQRLTARLVVAGGIVDKADVDAASSNQPIADAYGGLFPNRTATSPLVIVLLMVLLAYGVFSVSKTDLSRTAGIIAPTATSEPTDTPIRAVQEASPTPLAAPNPTPATPLEEVTVIEPEAAADATAAAASSNTAQTENRPLD